MAEKPMLFNTEMTRAILEDRKTQTRRLVKEIPLDEQHFTVKGGVALACDGSGYWYRAEKFCRVQPGDVLWVRETWQRLFEYDKYVYRADYDDDEGLRIDRAYVAWRPSIHMPREAARLFLNVTGVRIERLQDISPLDIKAEGIRIKEDDEFDVEMSQEAMERFEFERLWDSTIKPADLPKYGWEANPWVWRYTFERYTQGG